ncbi:MAG: hypothetical protein M1840_000549 [Geoglossum simile]|nr:MAG: hypothetical protein M1840_000549 [Geoglossum simile]
MTPSHTLAEQRIAQNDEPTAYQRQNAVPTLPCSTARLSVELLPSYSSTEACPRVLTSRGSDRANCDTTAVPTEGGTPGACPQVNYVITTVPTRGRTPEAYPQMFTNGAPDRANYNTPLAPTEHIILGACPQVFTNGAPYPQVFTNGSLDQVGNSTTSLPTEDGVPGTYTQLFTNGAPYPQVFTNGLLDQVGNNMTPVPTEEGAPGAYTQLFTNGAPYPQVFMNGSLDQVNYDMTSVLTEHGAPGACTQVFGSGAPYPRVFTNGALDQAGYEDGALGAYPQVFTNGAIDQVNYNTTSVPTEDRTPLTYPPFTNGALNHTNRPMAQSLARYETSEGITSGTLFQADYNTTAVPTEDRTSGTYPLFMNRALNHTSYPMAQSLTRYETAEVLTSGASQLHQDHSSFKGQTTESYLEMFTCGELDHANCSVGRGTMEVVHPSVALTDPALCMSGAVPTSAFAFPIWHHSWDQNSAMASVPVH